MGGDGGVMSAGDSSDDGEAEAVAVLVCAARIEALERLEEAVDLSGWNGRPGVGDREHRPATRGLGGESKDSASDVVDDGVVDEVGDEALDQSCVALQRGGADSGLDVQSEAFALEAAACQDSSADVREVGSLAMVEPAFGAGEGEKGFDEGLLFPIGGEELLTGRSPDIRGGGSPRATCTRVRSRVSGVRSSWEALATKRRCA